MASLLERTQMADKKTDSKLSRGRGRPRSPARTEFGRWMDRNGISAEVLATVGGCSQTSVNTIRRGMQLPSLTVASRFIVFSRTQGDPIDILAFFPKK